MSRLDDLRRMRAFLEAEIELEERRNLTAVDPNAADVVERAAALYDVPPIAVLSGARGASVSKARHAAAWMLRERGLSFPQIGRVLGLHHTTVIHACQKIDSAPTTRALLRGLAAVA